MAWTIDCRIHCFWGRDCRHKFSINQCVKSQKMMVKTGKMRRNDAVSSQIVFQVTIDHKMIIRIFHTTKLLITQETWIFDECFVVSTLISCREFTVSICISIQRIYEIRQIARWSTPAIDLFSNN